MTLETKIMHGTLRLTWDTLFGLAYCPRNTFNPRWKYNPKYDLECSLLSCILDPKKYSTDLHAYIESQNMCHWNYGPLYTPCGRAVTSYKENEHLFNMNQDKILT